MPISEDAVYGLTAAVLAGLLANALCLAVIRRRLGLDPVSERSNHNRPTPRLGGIAVLGGWCAASAVLFFAGLLSADGWHLLLLVLSAGAVGLVDDLVDLSASVKLGLLVMLSGLGAAAFGPVEALPVPLVGWLPLPATAGFLLAGFWLLSIVNVVNFMDGLNGLAGSFVIVVLATATLLGDGGLWPLLAAQAAILGFLFVNAFDGRIFLGDAGSLSLGYLVGAAALIGPHEGAPAFWLIPLVALPLIADVAMTLIRRFVRGEDLGEAHSEHLYQLLKGAGWSHQASSSAVVGTGVAAAVIALVMWRACQAMPLVYWLSVLFVALLWGAVMTAMLGIKARSRPSERPLR